MEPAINNDGVRIVVFDGDKTDLHDHGMNMANAVYQNWPQKVELARSNMGVQQLPGSATESFEQELSQLYDFAVRVSLTHNPGWEVREKDLKDFDATYNAIQLKLLRKHGWKDQRVGDMWKLSSKRGVEYARLLGDEALYWGPVGMAFEKHALPDLYSGKSGTPEKKVMAAAYTAQLAKDLSTTFGEKLRDPQE